VFNAWLASPEKILQFNPFHDTHDVSRFWSEFNWCLRRSVKRAHLATFQESKLKFTTFQKYQFHVTKEVKQHRMERVKFLTTDLTQKS